MKSLGIIKSTLLYIGIGIVSVNASNVLATVDGNKITVDEANRYIRESQPNLNFELLQPKQKQQIVQRLIERELFAKIAKNAGVEKDPNFQKALEQAKKDLMIKYWMTKQYKKTIVSEGEAKEFYKKNIDKFVIPQRVHARHILLKSQKDAQEIIDKLKGLKGDELKQKFIELAKTKSQGPTAKTGGDLGFFTKEQMVLPFSKATFSLKKGEITTKPVKTQFGYHVIYVEDKAPQETLPYEQVKDKIMQKLKEKEFADKMEIQIKEIKKGAKIENFLKKPKAKESIK